MKCPQFYAYPISSKSGIIRFSFLSLATSLFPGNLRSEQLEVRTQANQVKPMPSEEMKTEEGLKEVEDKHAGSLCVICCQNFASDEVLFCQDIVR